MAAAKVGGTAETAATAVERGRLEAKVAEEAARGEAKRGVWMVVPRRRWGERLAAGGLGGCSG